MTAEATCASDAAHEPRGRRSLVAGLGALALVATGGYLSWRRPETTSPPVVLAPDVTTVAPGVHLLGRTFPNASYVVETSVGLVLVDTCPEPDAQPILRQLRDLRLDPARLRAILLTHAHGDHSLGARALREKTGAAVHAGRGDCEVLRTGTPPEAMFSIFAMPQAAHGTPIDVELAGGEALEFGDATFRVIATPGHTPGSVCYLLEKDRRRILFTGDAVMSLTDEEPLTGPGIYPAFLSPRYRGNARDTLASLKKLLALPVPDLVLPGHPAADPRPQDPHLSQARWETLLRHGVAKMEILVERLEEDGADFLDGIPKELLPGLHYLGNFAGSAVYGLVTATGEFFLFDAPGGAGLPAFLEARLRRVGVGPVKPTAVLLTSCGPESTSGLASLVESTGCTVVVPHAGFDAVRKICPDGTRIVAAEALPTLGWFPSIVVPIQGLASPGAAYVLRWKGSTVVVSGHEPTRTTLANGVTVHRTVPWTGANSERYLQSLEALSAVAPDLWLPAVPINGQNANLYDADWCDVLDSNSALLR